MGKNPMFNGSGCKDPTAYSAISNIESERKAAIAELKKLLFGYTYICRTIYNLQEEIQKLGNLVKSERDTSKALTYNGDESQRTNAITDPTAQAVSNIIDKYEAQAKYAEQRLEVLYADKNRVDKYLDRLEIQEQELIELRYFKKMRWWQVAKQIKYCESHCKRINDQILDKLSRK